MNHATLIDQETLALLRREMLGFARLQLRDAAAAEDAVQEALAAALAGTQQFAGRAALKTWVFAILRHKIVDLIRAKSREVDFSALTPDEGELDDAIDAAFRADGHWQSGAAPKTWGDPEASLRQSQFWDVFDACLNHLPENTARVFMMRNFLELDTDEICRELRISTSNCHVILHRARSALRLCLERGWFGVENQAC